MLREIRAHSDVPVIITTGHRPDETDRIVGLELGADDYIIKPYSLRELPARVRAVLRRQEMGRAARARDPERGGYRFNGWKLERRGRRLIGANNTQVSLSKGEYTLLLALLEAPQRLLTREHLLQATRVHEDIFDRSIDVQVLRLRRKLETDPKRRASSRPSAALVTSSLSRSSSSRLRRLQLDAARERGPAREEYPAPMAGRGSSDGENVAAASCSCNRFCCSRDGRVTGKHQDISCKHRAGEIILC